jgi:hypothetical protein
MAACSDGSDVCADCLGQAFTKSASMEALLQARRQSKALSSDRLLPKEGHTVKVGRCWFPVPVRDLTGCN